MPSVSCLRETAWDERQPVDPRAVGEWPGPRVWHVVILNTEVLRNWAFYILRTLPVSAED